MRDHVHPLPVCGFGAHRAHHGDCGAHGRMIACGEIVDPAHPNRGMALCRHEDPPPPPPPPPGPAGGPVAGPGVGVVPGGTGTPGAGTSGGAGAAGGTVGTGHPAGTHGSGIGTTASGAGDGGALAQPEPVPETPTEPFDWVKWLRGLLGLILAGLLAWLCFWLWLWLKKIGFWTAVLEFFWRLFDWFRRLREWLEGPPMPPEVPDTPPDEPTPEEDEPPEKPLVCDLVHANIPANVTPIRLSRVPYTGVVDVSVGFDMLATFAAVCSRCEYRQEVMGRFEHKPRGTGNWVKMAHKTRSWNLVSETSFVDDGYGHRVRRQDGYDRYEPRRSDGCRYIGHDDPGMRISVGDAIHVNLDFQGFIWDIDPATGAMVQKFYNSWHVRILGRIAVREHRFLPWPNPIDFFFARTQLVLEPVP